MEERNIYEAPKAAHQIPESRNPRRLAVFLRGVLLVIFGAYSFFTVTFSLFTVAALTQGFTAKSIVCMTNTVFMALFAVMTFISLKRGQSQAILYSLLLLVVGFVTTAMYRMMFITNELGRIDFNNFLLFSIPFGLTYIYFRLTRTAT